MEKAKCRICLALRKRSRSLHDSLEKVREITYADIVASISDVKVSKTDEISIKICFACCKKLTDIYEFRCQIERSDIELQKTSQVKRIIFADIQDVKSKLKIEKFDGKYEKLVQNYLSERFVQSSIKSLSYNNTIINRLKTECGDSADKKTLSVKAFLESFKQEQDDEYDVIFNGDENYESNTDVNDNLNSGEDENYGPLSDFGDDEDYNPLKNNSYKMKTNLKKDKSAAVSKISIKPVYLRDVSFQYQRSKMPPNERKLKSRKLCPCCGKMVFCTKSHMATHIPRDTCLKCDLCSKVFYTKSNVIKHLSTCHGNKEYKCDKCVAAFGSKASLKKHTQSHLGLLPKWPCEVCGKAFKTKFRLWRHCQGVHNMGIKQFVCDQCTMTFVTKTALAHHYRVHTRERPFNCEICSQPYSYRTDFTRHCLKIHGVFLKGRKVNVMNEEVKAREQTIMKNLMLKVNGILEDDNPINPFEGPHSVKAFEQAVKALKARQIQIND